jgi:hypothetical protein
MREAGGAISGGLSQTPPDDFLNHLSSLVRWRPAMSIGLGVSYSLMMNRRQTDSTSLATATNGCGYAEAGEYECGRLGNCS